MPFTNAISPVRVGVRENPAGHSFFIVIFFQRLALHPPRYLRYQQLVPGERAVFLCSWDS